jgi:hypothetical protein
VLPAAMSPTDPPSGHRAYGWLTGQELEQPVHFVLTGVVLVLFGRENIGWFGGHVFSQGPDRRR